MKQGGLPRRHAFFGLRHEFITSRGVPQKWYTGRLHPEVGPLNYPFIYRFWQRSPPFRIPSIDKWYPFHTPSIELCIPFNNCKCIVFNISWINHKTRTFSQLFHCLKMHLLALLSLFTDEMTYFATHSYTSTSEIHNISFTWRLKKVTLWGPLKPLKLNKSSGRLLDHYWYCRRNTLLIEPGPWKAGCVWSPDAIVYQGHPMSIFGKYLFGRRFEI